MYKKIVSTLIFILVFVSSPNYGRTSQKIKNSINSPGLYYNLAILSLKKGEKPLAIYYLKKSIKTYPFYEKARTTLKQISNESSPSLKKFKFLLLIFYLLFIIGAYKTFILLKSKKGLIQVITINMVLFLILILTFKEYEKITYKGRGVIIKQALLKISPEENSQTIFKIPEGKDVRIIKEKNSWLFVEFKKLGGWLKKDSIKKL